jgi:putative ABC transport system permease protein
MAYSTAQRAREVGIRIALGARRHEVVLPLIREGVTLVAAGAAIGLVVAVPATRLMRGLLQEVSPTDPLTFAVSTVILVGASIAACYVPARRASRVDPVRALRGD